MSSSDPQPPVEPRGGRPSSTQEIPVVQPFNGATATGQLPPHPHATTHAPVRPMGAPEPTGPVDFVPGLPGVGTPPPPPPPPVGVTPAPDTAPAAAAAMETTVSAPGPTWPETLESGDGADDRPGRLRGRRPRNLAALLGPALAVLAVVLLELGLSLDFGGRSYWSAVTLWAAFATACALLALVAFVAAGDRLRSAPAWRVAAAGLVGVAVFWLLVVLPDVGSDRGFVLTAALGALGGALWVGPRRTA